MSETPSIPPFIPSGPTDDGLEGNITWDNNAIYTFYNGTWGKSPRTVGYWDEIDENTRFILCDRDQELSPVEKQTALRNIGVLPATTDRFGIVRYTDSWQDTGSGDPGEYPVTLTRRAIIELCKHTFDEHGYTIDVEIYGKCADAYAQAEEAADLAVSASEAAEGFAGEVREAISGAGSIYEDMLEAEAGAVSAYEGAVDSQEACEGFANDARISANTAAQKAPPAIVPLITSGDLQYGKVYMKELDGTSIDLRGLTLSAAGATVEIWLRCDARTDIQWPPQWRWLEGSAPLIEVSKVYYICVRNDGWGIVANIGDAREA